MSILQNGEEEAKKTYEIISIRNELSKEYNLVRLEVYGWEEMWRSVKMCQKFLYQIAPISWRKEHDWIHRSASGSSIASAKLDDTLDRNKTVDNSATLESLIGKVSGDQKFLSNVKERLTII